AAPKEWMNRLDCLISETFRLVLAFLTASLERPENRNEDDSQHPEDEVQGKANFHEIDEAVAASAIYHGICLIADRGGKAGRRSEHNSYQKRSCIDFHHLGR